MKLLVNYDTCGDNSLQMENIDLALSVLKASQIAIPELVKQMESSSLAYNPLMLYMFVETLR